MEQIIKYKNRRYYSKTNSQFIDLNYIINKIKANESIIVQEKNGNDVTVNTLKQCLEKLDLNKTDLLTIIKG